MQDKHFDETSVLMNTQDEQNHWETAFTQWMALRNIIRSFEAYNRPFDDVVRDKQYEGVCETDFYLHFKPLLKTKYSLKDPDAAYLYILKTSYAGVSNAKILSAEIKLSTKDTKEDPGVTITRKDRVYNIFLDVLIPDLVLEIDYYILPDVRMSTVASEKRRMKPGTFKVIMADIELNIATELTEIDPRFVIVNPLNGLEQRYRNLDLDIEYTVEGIKCRDIVVPERRDGKSYFVLDKRNVDEEYLPTLVDAIIRKLSDNLSTEFHEIKKRLIAAVKTAVLHMPSINHLPNIVKYFFCYNTAASPNPLTPYSSDPSVNELIMYFAQTMSDTSSAIDYIKERLPSGDEHNDKHRWDILEWVLSNGGNLYEEWNKHFDPPKSIIDDLVDTGPKSNENAFKFNYYAAKHDSLEMFEREEVRKAIYTEQVVDTSGINMKLELKAWKQLWATMRLFYGYRRYHEYIMYNRLDSSTKILNSDVFYREDQIRIAYYLQNISYSGFELSDVKVEFRAEKFQRSINPLPLYVNPEIKETRTDIEFQVELEISIPFIIVDADYNVESVNDAKKGQRMQPGHLIMKVINLEINAILAVYKIDPKFVHKIADTDKYFHFRAPKITYFQYKLEHYQIIHITPPTSQTSHPNPQFLTDEIPCDFPEKFIRYIIDGLTRPDEDLFKLQAQFLQNKLTKNIIPMPSIYNIYDVITFTLYNDASKNIKYRYNTMEEARRVKMQFLNPTRFGSSMLKYIKRTLRGKRRFLSARDIRALRVATHRVDVDSLGGGFSGITNTLNEILEEESKQDEEEMKQIEEQIEQAKEDMKWVEEETKRVEEERKRVEEERKRVEEERKRVDDEKEAEERMEHSEREAEVEPVEEEMRGVQKAEKSMEHSERGAGLIEKDEQLFDEEQKQETPAKETKLTAVETTATGRETRLVEKEREQADANDQG